MHGRATYSSSSWVIRTENKETRFMSNNRRWMTLLIATVLPLLGSCERSESTSTSGGGGGGTSIVYIAKNTGNPYFDPLIAGVRKAAEENGATFTSVAPATADATSQLPLIK